MAFPDRYHDPLPLKLLTPTFCGLRFVQTNGLLQRHGAAGLTRALIARKTKKQMAITPPEEVGELTRAIDGCEDSVTRPDLLVVARTFVGG
jgi:hypothetical protein